MHWPMTTKFGKQRQRWRAASNDNKETATAAETVAAMDRLLVIINNCLA